MAFQFSAVFNIMWNHPIISASILLLLTPSLFHILLYFSPLLITTTLFIVALVTMGPRMEETKQERETWAKGEKPVSLAEDSFPYPDWTSASDPVPSIKQRTEPPSANWIDLLDDWRHKLASWIDDMFRASPSKQPVEQSSSESNFPTESETKILPQVCNIPTRLTEVNVEVKPVPSTQPLEDVEVIKTVEMIAEENAPPVRELDMPELEIVEVPTAELKVSERAAAEALGEKGPVWDVEVPAFKVEAPETEVVEGEILEVPLNEPVQEVVREVSEKVTEAVEFPSPVASRSPKVVRSPPSYPDVRTRILQDLQLQLNELEEKRRNKYTQVLSRRMSMKNNSSTNKLR